MALWCRALGGCLLFSFAVFGNAHSSALASEVPQLPKHASDRFSDLISQLSADRFAVREAATRKLIEIVESRPFIEQLLESNDEELRQRARRIIEKMEERAVDRRLARYLAFGKRGEIDRMIEGLAIWRGPEDDPKCWQGVLDVAWDLVSRTNQTIGDEKKHLRFKAACPPWSLKRQRQLWGDPKFAWSQTTTTNGEFGFLRTTGVEYVPRDPLWTRRVVVSAGHVNLVPCAVQSIVFANGSFNDRSNGRLPASMLHGAIVILDGDYRSAGTAESSLIIARGNFEQRPRLGYSAIIATGKVGGGPLSKGEADSTIIQNSAKPLDFIRWFEPSTIGIAVAVEMETMRIEMVLKDSASARAGLRRGDRIVKVDGKAFESADAFRRLLRRGSVMDFCRLTVKRDGKMIDVWLNFIENEIAAKH